MVGKGATAWLGAATLAACAAAWGCGSGAGGDSGGGSGGSAVSSGGSTSSSGGATAASGGRGSGGAIGGGSGGTSTSTGGRPASSGGATASTGGSTRGSGGVPVTGGSGGSPTGVPAVLGPFTEDFEDGDLLQPNRWLSAVYDVGGDTSQWTTVTDGSKVAQQGVAAKETELVSGDYRWRDSFIESKVKLVTLDARAGVCVRYKDQRDKWCLYIENLQQDTTAVTGQIELRMRSMLGSASSLPKVKAKDLGVVASLAWNTVRLEVRGNTFTAIWNGVTVFTFTDTANLVDAGGIAIATMDGAMAEFDDVNAGPL